MRDGATCAVAAWLALAVLAPAAARGDDLEQLRTEVRQASATAPATPKASSGSSGDSGRPRNNDAQSFASDTCEDDDWITDDAAQAITLGAVIAVSAPFWGPVSLAGDDYGVRGYFPRYPYQQPLDGHMMIDPDLPRKPRGWAGRAYFDFRSDFDDLTGWGGGLRLDTSSRFGLVAEAHYLAQERLDGTHDALVIGSGDLVFRFAQSTWLEMRTGVGINWLADDEGTDAGVNFTYGGDWYPVKPLVVSFDLDLGKLGHASLFHGRITTGVQVKLAELYVGYDYLDVGKSQLNTALAGVRFSF